jgi:hypothetical protein
MIRGPNLILSGFARSFTARQPVDRISQSRVERNLKMRDESNKQRVDELHASNSSLIILDEHKNPRNNLCKLIIGIAEPRRDATREHTH